MLIIKNEIRPVGYCTIELSENEIHILLGVFEDLCTLRQLPFTEQKGTRGDIYKALITTLKIS